MKKITQAFRNTVLRKKDKKNIVAEQGILEISLREIESPRNVELKHHVAADPENELGFTGLPPKIQKVLESEGFTEKDVGDDLQIAVDLANRHLECDVVEDLQSFRMMDSTKVQKLMRKSWELKQADPNDDYDFDQNKAHLGAGAFGKVVQCVRKEDGKSFALKCIKSNHLDEIKQEIQMQAICGVHENIVPSLESFLCGDTVYIVMELMEFGSLSNYVSPIFIWNERVIIKVIFEMLKGIAFIHQHNHIHRDIKTENVLINARGEVKISDFGFATNLTKKQDFRETFKGTPHWMAPEIVAKRPYNEKVDIWSLGITLYHIAHGVPPHCMMKPMRALFLIQTGPAPRMKKAKKWSNELLEFIELTLCKDPSERASAEMLLDHDLFKKESCENEDIAALAKGVKKFYKKRKDEEQESMEDETKNQL